MATVSIKSNRKTFNIKDMPIKDKSKYPSNWEELVLLVKARGNNCCEICKVPNHSYVFRGILGENEFKNNEWFKVTDFMNMKPLPIEQTTEPLKKAAEYNYPIGNVWNEEQAIIRRTAFINGAKWQSEKPIETDFKSKFEAAIGLIESEIKDGAYRLEYLLNQIKQL